MSSIRFKANVGDSTVEFSVSDPASSATYEPANPDDAFASDVPVATTTKRRAVRQRFWKVAVYTTLGVLLSVAGYVTLTVLTGLELPAWAITIPTVIVSGLAGAAHKSIGWQEMGIEAPEVPDATVPALTLPTENP